MKILATGVSGFVGGALATRLASKHDWKLRAAVRRGLIGLPASVEQVLTGDLTGDADWRQALRGIDAVIHAAARVHVMQDASADPLAEFRRTNVLGTLNLARQAAHSGVRRFVFVSSIKVNGEGTLPGRPFRADDVPKPVDPYGISKHEAEIGLMELAQQTGLDVVIVRPVMVYGPGVKANFLAMMRWLHTGVPLPLGAIHNSRSLVALDNLTDLIVTCLGHPAAARQVFLVSDGRDLSTTELLRLTGAALKTRVRLLPVPPAVLETAARWVCQGDVAQRLCGSLQVDIDKTRDRLDWTPPVSVEDALRKTADHFLASTQ